MKKLNIAFMRIILILTCCCAMAPLAGAGPPNKKPTPMPHYGPVPHYGPAPHHNPIYNKPGPYIPKKPNVTGPLIPKKPTVTGPLIPKKPVVTGPHIPRKPILFNPNYHIPGSQKWNGPAYGVFKNYHPHWHNQFWWKSHYGHIVLVFGGWYYWNSGYWYPAWGYAPNVSYAYDGPIYASSPDVDPGQVVANVQSALQQQGYFQGEIDGILGTDTSEALAAYQQEQGLEITGAIDQPTLEALGVV